ncbi:MAG TPA: hypothetical protein VLF94_04215, partial [Chlamydiales bacterium]|nr:hypothetical protein [Chlamydiales bacterium]
ALLGTTLTVNSSLDTPPGTSSGAATGQLRAVLNYANQNPGLSPFTVVIAPGVTSPITLSWFLPILNLTNPTGTITIDGALSGGGNMVINGNGGTPFLAAQGTVLLQNLDISNCFALGGTAFSEEVAEWEPAAPFSSTALRLRSTTSLLG